MGQRTGRRQFLGGLLAAGLIPKPTWADAGAPAFLSAAARPDGRYVLCGITAPLEVVFEIDLPARGHAATAHPRRPEAVAFARRPGTFAVVIDCLQGRAKATLTAPEGRHFYGHGVYSESGDFLFTTENDFEAGQGRVGVWDVGAGYKRIAEFPSGGVGPHDIKRLPGRETLVVANGGIETHPASGRAKLNLPDMQPNLAYIDDGTVTEVTMLPAGMHRNSIRHLAVSAQGAVAFGMQWQGDGPAAALVGYHWQGGAMQVMRTPGEDLRAMAGYIGSIAFAPDGKRICVTSPRGGLLQTYDAVTAQLQDSRPLADVCGVAPLVGDFLVTSGTGVLQRMSRLAVPHAVPLMWDNHLVAVAA
ncbi:DUF1513 domain-containing protein [uncultured Sulfitobacter sp.]|uniref:DUF1513 domain-containing protein n=1 Tax=uncultured Sulfitobacter sp. TaxID=191468 RepID=UPI00262FB36D|nr:DUF1513 domain-containing protein [uncultured Sulfitobacter sp.]